MSRPSSIVQGVLFGLAGASALALAGASLAQPAPAAKPQPYIDNVMQQEMKAGAPPPGAPIPPGTPRGPGSLTGVWYHADVYGGGGEQRTREGDPIPMQPWVRAILDQRAADAKAGHPYASPKSRCLTAQNPGTLSSPRTLGMTIIEQPDTVTVLIEEMNNFRQIFLNAKHNPDAIPSYMGDSVGHWEGDTLVVESTAFNDDVQVDGGIPHSPELKTIMRVRRITPDRLEYYTTYDDPKAFTRVWTSPRRTLKLAPKGQHISEYLCTNQRNGTDANGKTILKIP